MVAKDLLVDAIVADVLPGLDTPLDTSLEFGRGKDNSLDLIFKALKKTYISRVRHMFRKITL